MLLSFTWDVCNSCTLNWVHPWHMHSKGYCIWFVCLSVCPVCCHYFSEMVSLYLYVVAKIPTASLQHTVDLWELILLKATAGAITVTCTFIFQWQRLLKLLAPSLWIKPPPYSVYFMWTFSVFYWRRYTHVHNYTTQELHVLYVYNHGHFVCMLYCNGCYYNLS